MKWKLWLDDERYPATACEDWRIARNVDDACFYIRKYGLPYHMSLDHDMGYGRLTGKDFCNWLVDYCLDNCKQIPDFYVHSMNPVGAENIQKYLDKAKEVIAYRHFESRDSTLMIP